MIKGNEVANYQTFLFRNAWVYKLWICAIQTPILQKFYEIMTQIGYKSKFEFSIVSLWQVVKNSLNQIIMYFIAGWMCYPTYTSMFYIKPHVIDLYSFYATLLSFPFPILIKQWTFLRKKGVGWGGGEKLRKVKIKRAQCSWPFRLKYWFS